MDIGSKAFPVIAGEKYYIRVKLRTAATDGSYSTFINYLNSEMPTGYDFIGTFTSSTTRVITRTGNEQTLVSSDGSGNPAFGVSYSTLNNTNWTTKEYVYTPSAGVKWVSLVFRNAMNQPLYVDSLDVRREQSGVFIEDGTLNATKIVANSITGDKIQAGTITADKLTIQTVGENLLSNPSFENYIPSGEPTSWKTVYGSSASFSSSTDYATDGARSLKIIGGGSNHDIGNLAIPVTAGEKYYFNFRARSESGSGTYTAWIFEYSSDLPSGKYYIGDSSANSEAVNYSSLSAPINISDGANETLNGVALTTLNGGWKTKECVYVPPAGVKWVTISFRALGGTLYIDNVLLRRFITGVQIQDDTITAGKLKAGSVTADKIAAGTITAEHLVVGGMSDNLIENPSFETPATNGQPAAAWAWTTGSSTSRVQYGSTGNYVMTISGGSGVSSRVIPVTPGQRFAVRYRAWGSGAQLHMHAMFVQNRSKDYIGNASGNSLIQAYESYEYLRNPRTSYLDGSIFTNPQTLTGTETFYEGVFQVPANMYWMSLVPNSTSGTVYIDEIEVRRQMGSAFITDLRAEQVRANIGDFGIVLSDQITQKNYQSYKPGSYYTLDNGALGTDSGWDETWASSASYDIPSDTLSFISPSNWNNTGTIVSPAWAKIANNTNGYLEFAINDVGANKYVMGGLSSNPNSADYGGGSYYAAIDYCWYIEAGTDIKIYESTTQVFAMGTSAQAGDVFRVAIENGYVNFRRNGVLIYTSPRKPYVANIRGASTTAEYRGLITTASNSAATIQLRGITLSQEGYGKGWRLNPLSGEVVYDEEPHWVESSGNMTSLPVSSGDTIDLNVGNTVRKIGGASTGWNASVVSEQTISAGDGYIEFIPDSATATMVGLSNYTPWNEPYHGVLDFAVYCTGGSIGIWQDGSNVANPGITYVNALDSIRVSIEGGKVRFRKNGAVFYEISNPTLSYPYRGKVCMYQPGDRISDVSITASTSGTGEFNSGLTIRGKRIEDIVRVSTTALRNDNRYRGNDTSVPSNQVTSIVFDTYFVSWEDSLCFGNISVNVNDFKTNTSKNMDTVLSVRTRVYDKTGTIVKTIISPWNGRGVAFSAFIPRKWADLKQEAVLSFEFENLYGFSNPVYYSDAAWLNWTNNMSYTAPTWKNPNDLPTNCQAIPISTTSVRVSWINANSNASGNHNVYYRPFKAEGYEGDASVGGWIAGPTNVTSGTADVINLQTNVRYEFMVDNTAVGYSHSNFAHSRTFLMVSAISPNGAPSALSGSPTSTSQINLSWVKNDTTGYTNTQIYYVAGTGTPDASSTHLGNFTGTTASATGLSANTTYTFRARNNYSGTYSEWSNAITVTTQAPVNNTLPSNAVLNGTGYTSVSVNWTANGGATTHLVQLAADFDFDFTSPIYNVSNTTKPRAITGLEVGTSYRARVSADGGSTWSNVAVGSTYRYASGGTGCVLETEPVWFVDKNGLFTEVEAGRIMGDDMVLGSHAGSDKTSIAKVVKVLRHTVDDIYTVKTSKGNTVKCSESHRIITSFEDERGLEAKFLKAGNKVLVYDTINREIVEDVVTSIGKTSGEFNIIELCLDSRDHTYISGGIVAHNRKADDDIIF